MGYQIISEAETHISVRTAFYAVTEDGADGYEYPQFDLLIAKETRSVSEFSHNGVVLGHGGECAAVARVIADMRAHESGCYTTSEMERLANEVLNGKGVYGMEAREWV